MRSATVRAIPGNVELRRPIQKLYPLEISNEEEMTLENETGKADAVKIVAEILEPEREHEIQVRTTPRLRDRTKIKKRQDPNFDYSLASVSKFIKTSPVMLMLLVLLAQIAGTYAQKPMYCTHHGQSQYWRLTTRTQPCVNQTLNLPP